MIRINGGQATLGANTFTGAQVAPSLALGGATIGTNALAVTGSMALGGGAITYSGSMTGNMSIAMSGLGINWAAARTISMSSLGNIGFAATDTGTATNDSAFSRISAGIIGVGTGAAGNVAGGLQAATLALGGATIGAHALNVIGTALFSGNFQVNSTISALALGNTGTAANSFIEMLAGGTRISRNVADALSALTVKQTNASSTGNIIDGVNSAGTVFSVSQSGAISVGNTVNSVSPTSPNRTVTMVIGGTTYYLAAKTTND